MKSLPFLIFLFDIKGSIVHLSVCERCENHNDSNHFILNVWIAYTFSICLDIANLIHQSMNLVMSHNLSSEQGKHDF